METSVGVVTRAELLRTGWTVNSIDWARRSGRLRSIRRGWYSHAGALPDAVTAVRVGGSLTCGRALALHEVWSMPESAVHVAVPANASRLRRLAGVVVHWRRAAGTANRVVDPQALALLQLAECANAEVAVAAIDSALNLKLVEQQELAHSFEEASVEARRRLALSDGSAQSGLETFARLRLRRHRIRLRTQVWIDGVGYVDLLVGRRLVVELDGFRFHTRDAFEEDRRRDLVLLGNGYLVLRLSYRQLMEDWDAAERTILYLVHQGEHR